MSIHIQNSNNAPCIEGGGNETMNHQATELPRERKGQQSKRRETGNPVKKQTRAKRTAKKPKKIRAITLRETQYRFKKEEIGAIFKRYEQHRSLETFHEEIAPFICFYARQLTPDVDQSQELILHAITNCEFCLLSFQKIEGKREFAPYFARFLRNTHYALYKKRQKDRLDETLLDHIEIMPQASLIGVQPDQEHNRRIRTAYSRSRKLTLTLLENLPMQSRTILKLYHGIQLTYQEETALKGSVPDANERSAFKQRYHRNLNLLRIRISDFRKSQQKFAFRVRQLRQRSQDSSAIEQARRKSKKIRLKIQENRILQSQLATMEDIGNLLKISKSTVYRRIHQGYEVIYRNYRSEAGGKTQLGNG